MVEVQGITKQYGGKNVIENISLKIPKGKITSFIVRTEPGKAPCFPLSAV